MDERAVARALDRFDRRANCAEAVLAGLCPEAAEAGVASGFGAGIARMGGPCGCLTGAALGLGLRAGPRDPGDEALKDHVYGQIQELYAAFEARFGAIDCRTLTGVDFRDPDSRATYDEAAWRRCREMVAWVVTRLEA